MKQRMILILLMVVCLVLFFSVILQLKFVAPVWGKLSAPVDTDYLHV